LSILTCKANVPSSIEDDEGVLSGFPEFEVA